MLNSSKFIIHKLWHISGTKVSKPYYKNIRQDIEAYKNDICLLTSEIKYHT